MWWASAWWTWWRARLCTRSRTCPRCWRRSPRPSYRKRRPSNGGACPRAIPASIDRIIAARRHACGVCARAVCSRAPCTTPSLRACRCPTSWSEQRTAPSSGAPHCWPLSRTGRVRERRPRAMGSALLTSLTRCARRGGPAGWFDGLSAQFLSLPVPKLLVLAGTDRLDKTLTVAHVRSRCRSARSALHQPPQRLPSARTPTRARRVARHADARQVPDGGNPAGGSRCAGGRAGQGEPSLAGRGQRLTARLLPPTGADGRHPAAVHGAVARSTGAPGRGGRRAARLTCPCVFAGKAAALCHADGLGCVCRLGREACKGARLRQLKRSGGDGPSGRRRRAWHNQSQRVYFGYSSTRRRRYLVSEPMRRRKRTPLRQSRAHRLRSEACPNRTAAPERPSKWRIGP
jgi:hypothetical protein